MPATGFHKGNGLSHWGSASSRSTPSNCLFPLRTFFCEARSLFLPHSISSLFLPFSVKQMLSNVKHQAEFILCPLEQSNSHKQRSGLWQECTQLYNPVLKLAKGSLGFEEKPHRRANRECRHFFVCLFLTQDKIVFEPGSGLRNYVTLDTLLSFSLYCLNCKTEVKGRNSKSCCKDYMM